MPVPESATPAEVMRAVLAAAADGDWAAIARHFDPEVQLWVNSVQPEPWHGAKGFATKVDEWRRDRALRDLEVIEVFGGPQACVATGRCRATIEVRADASVRTQHATIMVDVHHGRIVAVHLATGDRQVPPFH